MQIKEDIGLKFRAHKLAPAQAPHTCIGTKQAQKQHSSLSLVFAKKQITHFNFVKNIVIGKQTQM
jgi:hypothetical protein